LLCTGDVMQLGSHDHDDQTSDDWHLYSFSGNIWGFTLGRDNQFMACWDTGIGWKGPYKANGQPLRKKPFDLEEMRKMGCLWRKVSL